MAHYSYMIYLIFPIMLIYASISDIFLMKIPNWLNLAILVWFFIVFFMVGMDFYALGMHLLTALCVFVVSYILFQFRQLGGGDAKLFTVIALWFGFSRAFVDFIFLASIVGGGLTFLILIYRKMPPPTVPWLWLHRLQDRGVGVPYGVAMAIGGVSVYSESSLANAILALV